MSFGFEKIYNQPGLVDMRAQEAAIRKAQDDADDAQDDALDAQDDSDDDAVDEAKQRVKALKDKLKAQAAARKDRAKGKADKSSVSDLPLAVQSRMGNLLAAQRQAAADLKAAEATLRKQLQTVRKSARVSQPTAFVEPLEQGYLVRPGVTSAESAQTAAVIADIVKAESMGRQAYDGAPRLIGPTPGMNQNRNMPVGSAVAGFGILGEQDTAAAGLDMTRVPIDVAGGFADSRSAIRPGNPGMSSGNPAVAAALTALANRADVDRTQRARLAQMARAFSSAAANRGGSVSNSLDQPESTPMPDASGRRNAQGPQQSGQIRGLTERPYDISYGNPAYSGRPDVDNATAYNWLDNESSPRTPRTVAPSISSIVPDAPGSGSDTFAVGDTGANLPVKPHRSTATGGGMGSARITDPIVGRRTQDAQSAGRNCTSPGDSDSRIPMLDQSVGEFKVAGLTEAEADEVVDFIHKRRSADIREARKAAGI
jgi:hypothetical protein